MGTNSGFGIWLNADRSMEKDNLDYALSIDMMMNNGLEIGIDYWLEADKEWESNPIDLDINYYIKKNHSEIPFYVYQEYQNKFEIGAGMSWVFGIKIENVTEEKIYGSTLRESYGDINVSVGGSTSGIFSFKVTHSLYDTHWENTMAGFKKIWNFRDFLAGIGYGAYIENIGQGWIQVSLGSIF